MKMDGISLIEGSEITNVSVATGTEVEKLALIANDGELFYQNDDVIGLYVYDGITWNKSAADKDVLMKDGSIEIFGSLLPEMTGATGVDSIIDIGSPTQNINTLYVADVLVGANSLQTTLDNKVNLVDNTGRRNIIINGDMRIDQRFNGAVSQFLLNGAGGYFVDRMQNSSGSGISQCDRQQVAGFGGFTNAAQITTVTAESDLSGVRYNTGLHQRIEGYDCQAMKDKPITLSFWFKASNPGQYNTSFRSADTAYSYVTAFDYITANTPQKIEITVPNVPASYIINDTNDTGLRIVIGYLNAGSLQTAILDQ